MNRIVKYISEASHEQLLLFTKKHYAYDYFEEIMEYLVIKYGYKISDLLLPIICFRWIFELGYEDMLFEIIEEELNCNEYINLMTYLDNTNLSQTDALNKYLEEIHYSTYSDCIVPRLDEIIEYSDYESISAYHMEISPYNNITLNTSLGLDYYTTSIEEKLKPIQKQIVEETNPIGSVYIIGNDKEKRYKIGISINPKSRIRNLQTSSPIVLNLIYSKAVKRYKSIEKVLHSKFANKNIVGEWFNLTDNDVRLAKQFIDVNAI